MYIHARITNMAELSYPLALQEMRNQLLCPVCSNYYEDPVVLPCVHSFCRGCISRVEEDGQEGLRCPVCQRDAHAIEAASHRVRTESLRCNFQLAEIVKAFRAAEKIQAQYYVLKVPYTCDISDMGPGKHITVTGQPTDRCTRFHINLMRDRNFSSGDIALHFNPRFWWTDWWYIAIPWKVVVRNTRVKGRYGPEERRAPKFPFACGRPFKIEIICLSDKFDVFVDEEFFISYAHRIRDLASIKIFHVTGDVQISSVEGCSYRVPAGP